MKPIHAICLLVLFPLLFSTGCAKVAYYHTERASITLESKAADASQPVQGNIGVKLRTVVISQGKKDDTAKTGDTAQTATVSKENITAPITRIYKAIKSKKKIPSQDIQKVKEELSGGEAASVISDFHMVRTPSKEGWKFGKTTITSAFITGSAAEFAPAATATAIAGGPAPVTTLTNLKEAILREVYKIIDAQAGKKDPEALRLKSGLDALAKDLPDVSKLLYFQEDPANQIKPEKLTDDYSKDFINALFYDTDLRAQLALIEKIQKNQGSMTYNGAPITDEMMAQIMKVKKRIQSERQFFYDMVAGQDIVRQAKDYAGRI